MSQRSEFNPCNPVKYAGTRESILQNAYSVAQVCPLPMIDKQTKKVFFFFKKDIKPGGGGIRL